MIAEMRRLCIGYLQPSKLLRSPQIRCLATTTSTQPSSGKREGDISSAFASLSNSSTTLPERFSAVKASLMQPQDTSVSAHRERLTQSFHELLKTIASEIPVIKALGSNVIPSIDYSSISSQAAPTSFTEAHRRTGVAIVRGAVPEEEALQWLQSIKDYIRTNPTTKGFPQEKPAVWEIYWSKAQILARSDPRMLETMKFLMSHWHAGSSPQKVQLSTQHPVTYVDRLRIRPPGDAAFALGPHVDGGSCERWEHSGYGGLDGTYASVFKGQWQDFDAFDASKRLNMVSDLYQGAGACSMFRMYQGWLALSSTGPGEGTLKVNPLFSRATAYYLLRPFFVPRNPDTQRSGFLDPENWQLEDGQQPSSVIQGASPGHGQELSAALHPHLDLDNTMVSLPRVHPGDYIAWHCDTIHAVDSVHRGKNHSSVLYIPACPLTVDNARYLVRQRDTFLRGTPSPDFPGGVGESEHIGRVNEEVFGETRNMQVDGRRAMGFAKFGTDKGQTEGEKRVLQQANQILGL